VQKDPRAAGYKPCRAGSAESAWEPGPPTAEMRSGENQGCNQNARRSSQRCFHKVSRHRHKAAGRKLQQQHWKRGWEIIKETAF